MADSGNPRDEGSSPPNGNEPHFIDALSAPMSVLKAAIRAVPAVRYALGLAGVAAAASIISRFVGTGVDAVATIGLLLIGMIILYIFSALTTRGMRGSIELPAKVILWVATICVSILLISLTTAVTFAVPENIARLLNVKRSTVEAISDNSKSDDFQSKFGYIYLGKRDDNKWINDEFAFGRIIDSDGIPVNGDIRTIVQGVHLRKSVPDEGTPLVMKADLGAIKPGTRVRIKTVTKLDPGGYYWASVDIL